MAETDSYTGKDIQILEGLDPVRKRPGMYIGGTGKPGLHHLLWEIVDNGVDEATNGYASAIEVVLHRDGASVTVTDNGRGIPVDRHPEKRVPALQVILTTLHSGAKFDGTQYITSGGLHGVGASVVNALSSELVATVRRDGKTWRQRYVRGVPKTALREIADGTRGSGTTIFFRPDERIFETVTFDPEWITEQLEIKTYLNRNLKILFKDEVRGNRHVYHHEGGIAEYLGELVHRGNTRPVHEEIFTVLQREMHDGARIEVALQWTEAPKETVRSFVNGIPTRSGGTHEQGFKTAVRSAVRAYLDTHNLVPRGVDLSADDIREGIVAIVNVFMIDPQFQGQTKEKLNSTSARTLVSGAVRLALEQFLNSHPTASDRIAARVIQAARARLASRAAARSARKKARVYRRLTLPGKLADCSSNDPEEAELFIVEGDSAGGSAKQGRDRTYQAVLPLRGKVLNVEQASLKRVVANNELSNVMQALGCGLGAALDLSKLRYHKVILLMDADSDGHHIATLLLTFFYRHMRQLIDGGHVYVAEPPLYRLNAGKETYWAQDDKEKARIVRRLKKRRRDIKIDIQRFKGLGEMMPNTLKKTTLDPSRRRLLQVTIPEGQIAVTDSVIGELMGKDAAPRYRFIMNHAVEVQELDV